MKGEMLLHFWECQGNHEFNEKSRVYLPRIFFKAADDPIS